VETEPALVPGVRAGHWTAPGGRTGTTVVVPDRPAVAAVDVRGSAPATTETDALAPWRLVERIDAVVLSGGSALGLGTAHTVREALREAGRGVPTSAGPVPIVAGACIFDLVESGGEYPPPEAGALALAGASTQVEWGRVGAGAGATVGKHRGARFSAPSGIGAASVTLSLDAGEVHVGAVVAVNAFGDVVDDRGETIAGSSAPPDAAAESPIGNNTLIGVITTTAALNRSDAQVVACAGHDGYARSVLPSHTRYDGDTIFAMAVAPVGAAAAETETVDAVVAVAAEVVAAAVRHGAESATLGGFTPGGRA